MTARPATLVAILSTLIACPRDSGSGSGIPVPVPVEQGGTGATTAAGARANLGTPSLVGPNSLTGDLTVSSGRFVGEGLLSGNFSGVFAGDGSGLDVLRRTYSAAMLEGCTLDGGSVYCGSVVCAASAATPLPCSAMQPPCRPFCADAATPVVSATLARPVLPAPGALDVRVESPATCFVTAGSGTASLSLLGQDCPGGACGSGVIFGEVTVSWTAGGWSPVAFAVDSGFPWIGTAGEKLLSIVIALPSPGGATCFVIRESPAGTVHTVRAFFQPVVSSLATW